MARDEIAFWMAVAGMVCWAVCFLWMHQISAKQNRLMTELHEQGQRIERFSKTEHDLVKEVHPQVGDIKAGVEEVMAAVRTTTDAVHQLADQNPTKDRDLLNQPEDSRD
jgi:hypothetical protein